MAYAKMRKSTLLGYFFDRFDCPKWVYPNESAFQFLLPSDFNYHQLLTNSHKQFRALKMLEVGFHQLFRQG